MTGEPTVSRERYGRAQVEIERLREALRDIAAMDHTDGLPKACERALFGLIGSVEDSQVKTRADAFVDLVGERDRYRDALVQAHAILRTPSAASEASPGNKAWAVLTAALAGTGEGL